MFYYEAINDALKQAMQIDEKVLCYGLGVDDPKRVFSTTKNLQEQFGEHRVFDMPTSENAMTGVAIGAALGGYRPVMVHQRLDFFLLTMDQLVNSAAKWYYMFGGQKSVPIVIRLIIGRGWGQGPTHSQALHSWFAHIPGLKVIMPSTPSDAKGLLLSSIFDGNPVIFIEHRWLYNQEESVPTGDYRIPIGKSRKLFNGNDITIVANTYMTVEAIHAVNHLQSKGVTCDLIDLRTIRPLDLDLIEESVEKTGRLLVLDIGSSFGSVAGEIIAKIAERKFSSLKAAPSRICMPDYATPTSFALTKGFYPGAAEIIRAIEIQLNKTIDWVSLTKKQTWPHDVPGNWFKGPF